MRVVKDLADELSEADLAVFGIEDQGDMASPAGITSIGYSLDALPDRATFRAEDLMGRWGEDEFAVVLVNCTTVSAVQLCWRLREETPEGHSFSAGLASYQGTETVDDLVDRADDCLAQARAKGRDRTVAEGLVDLD